MKCFALCLALVLGLAQAAQAHFGLVIPSQPVVEDKAKAAIDVTVAFIHPMEMNGMNMEKPLEFGVVSADGKVNLLPGLKETKAIGHKAWQGSFTPKRPGVYSFYSVPAPYWEPAEDKFIQHITKVVVPAFGEEEGWDKPLGLKTEIVPLTRPFGNYAGNIFTGQVLLEGKPVAGCDVEVEFYNKDKKYAAPNDYMNTQMVKTDANGVFSFAVPWEGWWGFAALNDAPEGIVKDGKEKKVEMGAVIWVDFVAPKLNKK
jgi:ABC-type Co2+ transport system, periplasmic component